MKGTSQADRSAWQDRFISELNRLDRAERARLRRNAGNTLGEGRRVLGLFYRILPAQTPEWMHERCFLVATLFPNADSSNDRNFGASLRRVRTEQTGPALDRRFAVLLDADLGQLPFRLRQMVRLVHARRGGINWLQLLRDLSDWNRYDPRVQKQWAMAYFGGLEPPESSLSAVSEPEVGNAASED
jgi:CRISPR type I-E-associated protein CasB/Cse2